MESTDQPEFGVALAEMARDLLAQESVQATLDRIVAHAVGLVGGCEHAGILLLHGGQRVETAAATSDLVRASDRAQGEFREGPCFDAIDNKQKIYRIADLSTNVQRWPHYAPRARELGVESMMGFLLYTEDRDLGALDFYCSKPGAFTEDSELAGWMLASHAAVAFSAARTSVQLQSAIATRQDIGEALGIVMERYKLTDEQAFELLKKISQDRNIKLRGLAQMITTSGEIPSS